MNNNDGCCLNCTDRKIGCHSRCERFLEYRERLNKINARKREIKFKESSNFRYKKGR